MSEELKDCPFCGQGWRIEEINGRFYFHHDNYYCPLSGKYDRGWGYTDKDKVIEELNMRYVEDNLRSKLKLAKDAIERAERLLDNNHGFNNQETIDAWNVLVHAKEKLKE